MTSSRPDQGCQLDQQETEPPSMPVAVSIQQDTRTNAPEQAVSDIFSSKNKTSVPDRSVRRQNHSSRNATIGSTLAALRAGKSEAAIATTTKTSAATAKVTPSTGGTPYNMAVR